MPFDLADLLAARRGQGYELQSQYVNAQVPKMLHAIGFDKVFDRAEGAYYWDAEGNRYLDFLSGFGVFALGRNHPAIRKALHDVLDAGLADMLQFDAPLLVGLLAEQLIARSGMERVYFCNSGSEAVEAALKFARCATGKKRILFCDHAYHGLTVGTLSVNGAQEFRKGFDPLLPDTKVPFGDLDALEKELRKGDVAGLLIEPIQGKGVNITPDGFLRDAQVLLKGHGALLIADEVQSGLGRTGKFYAHHYEEGAQPDIITAAKALSGGFVPVGATLMRPGVFEKVYSSLDRVFVHASTFMGNALAMTAGLATLSVIDDEKLLDNAHARGEELMAGLRAIAQRQPTIADVRGRGLMIGIEFGKPPTVRGKAMWSTLNAARKGLFAQMVVVPLFTEHRILTQVAGDHMAVIKLIPPLTITSEDVQEFLRAFEAVMAGAEKPSGLALDFGKTLVQQALKR